MRVLKGSGLTEPETSFKVEAMMNMQILCASLGELRSVLATDMDKN